MRTCLYLHVPRMLTPLSCSSRQASDSLHEVATDCVCSALFLIEEDLKYQPLAKALFTGVFTLAEPYQLAVAEELVDKLGPGPGAD